MKRDSVVTVTASRQWTVICPGTVSGQPAFDKAELKETNF
jgi:streptomycin 6-kinase